ncbi:MAG: peptide chain release factor 1 [Elusimicrobia bacterium]|nr:peptide chain release factor 1 [Elusimicrobiota bacterium]
MIRNKIDSIARRFKELETLLSDPSLIARMDEYRKLSREHSRLVPVMKKSQEYISTLADIGGVVELQSSEDAEMKAVADAEFAELTVRKGTLERELKVMLLPPDPNDGKNIIVEIRAGTGGDEAALFAGELLRMYTRYAEIRGWKAEIIDSHETGLGGFKEVIFSVTGSDVWRLMKFERGIHRVQRVPETEASGRIHTSAVTVAVLPEAEDVDIEIRPEDLRIDTYRASGAGGQHINKTDSAIRITHLPTNLVVACQVERSQIKNRATAMRLLQTRLLEKKQQDHDDAIMKERRQQVGSGDRSEKIRTYNFPQNRITDHRIDYSMYRLKDALEGDLDELMQKLITDEQTRLLSTTSE